MTHFPVVVCVEHRDDLEAALAPFDENETGEWHPDGDAQAKWDWWQIGGRWGGYFRYFPDHGSLVITPETGWSSPEIRDGYCDGGPKLALDLNGMRNDEAAEARNRYDEFTKVVNGTPEALPWSSFAENISEGNGLTIDEAREQYRSQPRVQAINGSNFDWLMGDAIAEMQVPRDLYIERARAGAVPGWAILTLDGRWMEQGQMGWWAMNDASEGSKIGFWEAANSYIESLPDQTWLIAVDCHI